VSAVGARARSEVRNGWRNLLVLSLMIGVAGGASIAAFAGARRTDSAYRRFLSSTRSPDIFFPLAPWLPNARIKLDALRAIPEVAATTTDFVYFSDGCCGFMVPSADPLIGRAKLVAGRAPVQSRVDEVTVGFSHAESLHLGVGDTLRVTLSAPGDVRSTPDLPAFRIVGITATPGDFPPNRMDFPLRSPVRGTLAFRDRFGDTVSRMGVIEIRLRRGAADLPAFDEALTKIGGNNPYFITKEADHTALVERSIHLQAVALRLLALLLGIVALLILSQVLAREISLGAAEQPTLRALGMSRGQLWSLGMVRAALMAFAGAIFGAVVAAVLSPLTPIGIARIAEPHPGFQIDVAIIALGGACVVLLVLAIAAWPSWRAARLASRSQTSQLPSGRARPSFVASSMNALTPGPAITVGTRMALEPGRGPTAVPVRSTMVSVTLGIAAIAMAFVFGASLNHLLRTPRLYGWNVDVAYFADQGVDPKVRAAVSSDPRVEAISEGGGGIPLQVGSRTIAAFAQQGTANPPIIEGRAPGGPLADTEILLGSETMRDIRADIGSIVDVKVAGTKRGTRMRVVGRAVFPPISDTTGLGKGALITYDALLRLVPGAGPAQELNIRFAPGVDKAAAIRDLKRIDEAFSPQEPIRPTDLINFGRVQSLPLVLAGLLVVLGAATLAQTLVTSIKRRARDFAVLKTIGFVGRQVRGAVAWESAVIASIALVIGLPLGAIAGRLLWNAFASQLGVLAEPAIAWWSLVFTIPATIAVAIAVAAFPARSAARAHTVVALRAE